MRAGQTALESGEAKSGDSTYFNRTIVILLHLVCLFTKLIPHLEKEQVNLCYVFIVKYKKCCLADKICTFLVCLSVFQTKILKGCVTFYLKKSLNIKFFEGFLWVWPIIKRNSSDAKLRQI